MKPLKKKTKSLPTELSSAYKAVKPPMNLRGGSQALKPKPVRKSKKK